VQHAILFGEHELTIDDKNRLLVPAEVRKAIDPQRDGEAFFLVVGENHKIWFYAEKNYQTMAMQPEASLIPDANRLAFDQLYFALASRVEWDKQGRLVVPDKLMRRTNTGRDVTLVGVRDHLELWNRAEWEKQFDELQARAPQIRESVKLPQSPAPARAL